MRSPVSPAYVRQFLKPGYAYLKCLVLIPGKEFRFPSIEGMIGPKSKGRSLFLGSQSFFCGLERSYRLIYENKSVLLDLIYIAHRHFGLECHLATD